MAEYGEEARVVADRYPTHSLDIVDTADAPLIARRFVRDVLIDWGVAEHRKRPSISEVVAQSIVASSSPQLTIEVRCRGDAGLRISVHDRHRHRRLDDAAQSPGAIQMLQAVAADFGIEHIEHDADSVWVDIPATVEDCVPEGHLVTRH